MKRLGIIAAAIVGFFTVPTAASAYVQQPAPQSAPAAAITLISHAGVIQRWDDRRDYRRGRYERREYRRHRRWSSDRGGWRTRCHTQWRGGHRERVCRRIRYR